MNRTLAAAGLAALATVGGGAVAQAVAAPAAGSHGPRFVASIQQTSGLGAQGVPSGLGGRGTVYGTLRRAGHGATVGDVELELQVTSTAYPSTILETGVLRFRHHGTLAVQGVQAENQQTGVLAVVGGTGDYRTAAGTIHVRGSSITVLLAHR